MRPGHDIRTSGQTVAVLNPGAPISNDANSAATWVLSGELPTSLPPKARVLLLNIPAMAATLAWLDRQAPASVAITLSYSLCVELLCEAWFTWTDCQPSVRAVRVIGGTGLSVPDWLPFSEP